MDPGRGRVERQIIDTNQDPDMLAVSFAVDPTVSKIAAENMNLARYMRD